MDIAVMRNDLVLEAREMNEESWQMCPKLALHVQAVIEAHLSSGTSRKLLQTNSTPALVCSTRTAPDLYPCALGLGLYDMVVTTSAL